MLLNGLRNPVGRNSLFCFPVLAHSCAISRINETYLLISILFQSGVVLFLSYLVSKQPLKKKKKVVFNRVSNQCCSTILVIGIKHHYIVLPVFVTVLWRCNMAVLIRGCRCKNGCVYFVENDFIRKTSFCIDLWQYYHISTSELFQPYTIKSLGSSRFKVFN